MSLTQAKITFKQETGQTVVSYLSFTTKFKYFQERAFIFQFQNTHDFFFFFLTFKMTKEEENNECAQ